MQRTKIVFDVATGIESVVPLTPEEIAESEALAAQMELEVAQREAEAQALAELKASAKSKLIAGEPLTQAEADTLVL